MKRSSILVLNAGSSSLKVALFDGHGTVLTQGVVKRVGSSDVGIELSSTGRTVTREGCTAPDDVAALRLLIPALEALHPSAMHELSAVGHRIVHGGARYTAPTSITEGVQADLDALRELAPLHNERAIEVVRGALAALPGVPQVACFDTMFHATLPPEAAEYAIPRELAARYGIRRYGFHGLSCAWSVSRLQELEGSIPEKLIICHLGAGASATATLKGRSIDTTMGFTPLEGLIMATRSGSIDPSIPLYLQRHAGMGPDEIEQMLERESGLLGLSGQTGDVQALETLAASGDERAEAALSAFAYRVRTAIGSLGAALGGVDALVFTGGIGEHSPSMRTRILAPLASLGLRLDQQSNAIAGGDTDSRVNPPGSHPSIWVITAQEERIIARQVMDLLGSSRGPH